MAILSDEILIQDASSPAPPASPSLPPLTPVAASALDDPTVSLPDHSTPDFEIPPENETDGKNDESGSRGMPVSAVEVLAYRYPPETQDQASELDLMVEGMEPGVSQAKMAIEKGRGIEGAESDSSLGERELPDLNVLSKGPVGCLLPGDGRESPRLRRRKFSGKELGKSIAVPTKQSSTRVTSTLTGSGIQGQPVGIAETMDGKGRSKEAESQDIPSEDSERESEITTCEGPVQFVSQDGEKMHGATSSWSTVYDSEEGETDEEGRLGTDDDTSDASNVATLAGRMHVADDGAGIDAVDGEAEERGTREVYRTPKEHGQHLGPLISWPTGWVIQALGFQIRLLGQALLLAISVFHWGYSFVVQRVQMTLEAKDKATEAVTQKLTMISQVPPKVTEGGGIMVKKMAWGCLAAAYVCIFLSMLLFPAFFLDFMFVTKFVEEPINIRETLHFDYTQPNPSAVLYLRPSYVLGASKGRLVRQPNRIQSLRPIPISHRIHITVILTLPESDYNRQLGMFQLAAELLSANSEVIERSSHPCMLRFHSPPVRLAKTLLVGLPVLVGIAGETQTLVVRLMEHQEQIMQTNSVRVLLQPKAGFPVGAGLPELYSAEILIESHLPWVKELVRNWKWTFYVWSGLALYMLEIMMVVCCCKNALLPTTWGSRSEEEAPRNIPGRESRTHGTQQDTVSRGHPRGKRRVYFEHDLPTAKLASGSLGINMSTRAELEQPRRAGHDESQNGSDSS